MKEQLKELLKSAAKLTKDTALLLRPLTKKEKWDLKRLSEHLNQKELKQVTNAIRQKKARIQLRRLGFSFLISGKDLVPALLSKENEIRALNDKIEREFYEARFEEFSTRAWDALPQYIAPNIIGLIPTKQAAILQLFTSEPLHILMLGDPGTGKTDILHSVKRLASIASFGLGSGTSGAGLSVTVKGKRVSKGLLPMADGGLCCIDELSLMKKEDRAGLLNAMEKGFVSYDKGGEHYQFDARIRLLATANPKEDKFKSYKLAQLKKQLPFDAALLTRFHLVFFVKKASLKQFAEIAEKIISEDKENVKPADLDFIKRYIQHTKDLDVKLPNHLTRQVKNFAMVLKARERRLPYTITPRTVKGIIALAKASARLEMRNEIQTKDLDRVFGIFKSAVEI